MRINVFVCLLVLIYTAATRVFSQVNMDFESNLTGWTTAGIAGIDIT